MSAVYGWGGLVLALIAFFVWLRWAIRKGATAEAMAEEETRARLQSERARQKERDIRHAAERVRRQPGPRVPGLDELRPPAGDAPPPPA